MGEGLCGAGLAVDRVVVCRVGPDVHRLASFCMFGRLMSGVLDLDAGCISCLDRVGKELSIPSCTLYPTCFIFSPHHLWHPVTSRFRRARADVSRGSSGVQHKTPSKTLGLILTAYRYPTPTSLNPLDARSYIQSIAGLIVKCIKRIQPRHEWETTGLNPYKSEFRFKESALS
ncbi:hypothetical protein N658DRAFT_501637 [Parathielavia hyrcaniae]|uniref:Uncharacterized protein n=1 Tax=Parathielavia hyrcaniae TaxID=113614 RepID=A0AAN6SXF4_9PEZI|nr:hypothetical protein N658DRAFT_501637 [Parathielavia hyrcaniae]